ncbi:MAG TPA: HD domain-containing protein [Aggregatilineaceae bacterium]|nr:HD domain-containing protein [Aggregatilineaceae bacterium]
MKIPTCAAAQALLAEAEQLNPGPWVQHSIYVGEAARAIAARHPDLDAETAFTLGCLHDIGRRVGVTDMRHVLDGYTYLHEKGYEDAAQICLTHSFVIQHIDAVGGQWDCTADELQFIKDYLGRVRYTDYDRLIQLCDALALPSGFCLIEKRFVDVTMRRGFNAYTIQRWQGYLDVQRHFETIIGCSVYAVLPGVVENTFGEISF